MSDCTEAASAVLITGASTGIGAACALELDRRGYRVFAGVRRPEDGKRLQAQASTRLASVILDVTDPVGIQAAADTLRAAIPAEGLAALINNAGIVVAGPLEILPLDAFRRQLEVNLIGLLAVTQAMLPLLRRSRGRLINIGSANGALSAPYLGAYSASKHALEAVTDALRLELRHTGITVSIVEPGPIRTPIWEKSRSAADALAVEVTPEALDLYTEELDRLRTLTERLVRQSLPVEHVVEMVVHALTSQRPKSRYFGTWTTRLCFKGFRMLPDWLRDRILCRQMGLP
jgi:NAD(P)-dependent dehydrogenase (short-subunit alcohol dehydrogenase family)